MVKQLGIKEISCEQNDIIFIYVYSYKIGIYDGYEHW